MQNRSMLRYPVTDSFVNHPASGEIDRVEKGTADTLPPLAGRRSTSGAIFPYGAPAIIKIGPQNRSRNCFHSQRRKKE